MTNITVNNSYVGADALLNKLANINKPKVTPLSSGNCETVEDLWNKVIYPLLPAKDVMLRWHKVLMEYVKSPRAMFAIRGYNTAQRDSYHQLRRGFLTRTSEGYSFFYTDNFHAAYILKLAMDGVVPSVDALLSVYNSRKFPSRFGRDTKEERELMSIFKGKDPGIQGAGYKLAHIYNVGKDYAEGNRNLSLIRGIVDKYYPRGERADWVMVDDETGAHYERFLDVQPEARSYLVAEFLRFVHPFNYFLVPKKSNASLDVSENHYLISFVMTRMREMYGAAYDEFVSYIKLSLSSTFTQVDGGYSLPLSYGPEIATDKENGLMPKVSDKVEGSQSLKQRKNNTMKEFNMKIGEVIQSVVRPMLVDGCCTEEEITWLTQRDYCHQVFGTTFPVLSSSRERTNGVCRYYADPLTINGRTYYLSSQWYERQRERLTRWIARHQQD